MTKRITVFVAWLISLMIVISYSPAIPILADSTEYPLSEVVDYDYDDDGVVDIDDALYAVNLYFNQEYDRAVDSNYDGVVAKDDVIDTIQHYYDGLDIVAIRQAVKNGHSAKLHWENIDFTCRLQGLNPKQVESYTREWLDVRKHPYQFGGVSEYVCADFTSDYMLAAYKDLGYGCLLSLCGITEYGDRHAENAFWNGQDSWHNLDNWYSMNSKGFVHKLSESDLWAHDEETYINFPVKTYMNKICKTVTLAIDWNRNSVDYGQLRGIRFCHNEEPTWVGEWDTMIT